MLDATWEVFRADRVVSVSVSGSTLREFRSASDLMLEFERLPEVERDPLERAVLCRGGAIVAAIGSEPWANVGGPRPYHDSFTIPIYSADDAGVELEEGRARPAVGWG